MPDICIGRDEEDQEQHGLDATGLIAKHLVGEGHEAHTANPVYLDLARPHVMGIFGKRGTGKCLMPDEKVLTSEGLREIRDIFTDLRSKGQAQINESGEELYQFEGPEVFSVDDNFSMEEKKVVAGYRKKVNEKLLRIKTKSGREITVTKEHPLFTADGWENADNLSTGDNIGVPRKIDIEGNQALEVPDSFMEADYSTLNRRESELLVKKGGKISEITDGTGSYRRMLDSAESRGLIEVQEEEVQISDKGSREIENRLTSEHYRYGKAKPIKIPEKVSANLAEFMAYMIAEGHEQKINKRNYRLIFTNKNSRIIQRFRELGKELFDLEFKEMDQNSIYANSVMLEKFFETNGYNAGGNSFTKNIPNFILASESAVSSRFLQAYFDSNGNVTNQQIELTTASRDIAEAINYMLLKFGIVGRIKAKEKYASNTEEQKVRSYYQITVSGSDQLRKFKNHIDFEIERKSEKLSEILKEHNTNVDTIACSELIKQCRTAAGADRTQLVKHKQSLKAYEDGKYSPSREKLSQITSQTENYLDQVKSLKSDLEERPTIESIEEFVDETSVLWKEMNQELGYSRTDKKMLSYKKFQNNPEKLSEVALRLFENKTDLQESRTKLDKLNRLVNSEIFWDSIEKIDEINYEGWVYDLTVEDNHSFTAGFGGLLCHNSYSMGTIAEEIHDADISDNLSTVIIDSMGVYWSMKKPNERAAGILEKWDLKPKNYDTNIYIPEGKTEEFAEREIPYDETFTINPGELTSNEWAMALNIDINSEMGILLDRTISKLTETAGEQYQLRHILKGIHKFDFDKESVRGLENRLENAEDWGVFGKESSLEKFTQRGEMSIIDMSVFGEMGSGWSIRGLVVALLAKRILRQRMNARRIEEVDEMQGLDKNEMPITWMLIDEAHQFIPSDGETPATKPLLRWVKVGREPGVSLVLATQQPAKLHPNALSQCDLILSHRLTAKQDIESLGEIMQSYMRKDIGHYIEGLPDEVGTGLVLDDNSERIYPIKMRPRKSWHAGGTPDAYNE